MTIDLGGVHMHGYVATIATKHKRAVSKIIGTMLNYAEKDGPLPVPIILQTSLTSGVKTVRDVISQLLDVDSMRFSALREPCVVFLSLPDSDADKRLMALH